MKRLFNAFRDLLRQTFIEPDEAEALSSLVDHQQVQLDMMSMRIAVTRAVAYMDHDDLERVYEFIKQENIHVVEPR